MSRRAIGNAFAVATGIAILVIVFVFTGWLAGFIESYQPLWRLRGQ